MRQTLIPWDGEKPGKHESHDERKWRGDWEFAVEVSHPSRLLEDFA